ncbi:PTH2 family peptidyl-tRNA hydrolase [Pseudomonas nitritireducens]|uniref:peptidyl-tRNA hydrolase n=1 Tax=Pseudomonas nitroreducens TaxID=46680 RepID=A0A7W7NZF9_PSENT|nr:aminoacyl-tRNA hydrolase [Pseudomonas nitritireducens]MBB4861245.1 PTH2 family peptidyl-tRNA hydrolase [Pseudomonas nitritireducens]
MPLDELAQLIAGGEKDEAPEEGLYIYSIVPTSLEMDAGKASAQNGHAFEYSLKCARHLVPEIAERYENHETRGSKVALKAKNQQQLVKAYVQARELGLPCALVADRTHVMPPHFDGSPIITACAIGPCTKAQARPITKKFQCL